MVQSTLSVALAIAILVSLVKPILELWVKPEDQIHDTLIRILAVVIGVVGEDVNTAITSVATAQTLWSAAGTGLMDGVFAVAAYHLTTSSYFAVTAKGVVVQKQVNPV